MQRIMKQDKNQTSIGRMQSDSRSETGTTKILTVLEVSKHYIVFRDRRRAEQPLPACGGLAQLGERLPCKQEVSGSIPLISTTYGLIAQQVRAHA